MEQNFREVNIGMQNGVADRFFNQTRKTHKSQMFGNEILTRIFRVNEDNVNSILCYYMPGVL